MNNKIITIYLMRVNKNRCKIGYTTRKAKARAYELTREHDEPYSVIAIYQFLGNRHGARLVESATQVAFNAHDKIAYDDDTDDHFIIDGRLSDNTLNACFLESVAKALRAYEELRRG